MSGFSGYLLVVTIVVNVFILNRVSLAKQKKYF